MQVNMLEAKTQLSKLVEAAMRGEEVLIANRGKPMVRLVKAEAPPERRWGAWSGLVSEDEIEAAFDPAFEAELAAEWQAWADAPTDPTAPGETAKASKTRRTGKARSA